eukprot:648148-Alexandrium_andersonii.AAC.1
MAPQEVGAAPDVAQITGLVTSPSMRPVEVTGLAVAASVHPEHPYGGTDHRGDIQGGTGGNHPD